MKHSKDTETAEMEQPVIPVEIKIWSYLQRYKNILLSSFSIILAAWAFHALFAWGQEKRIQFHLAKYAKLTTHEEQLRWAETRLPKGLNALKGFIFLEKANKDFNKRHYEEAANYYQKAIQYLTISPLLEHAQLGYAFSELYDNHTEEAKSTLISLTNNNSAYLKALANYTLGYLAHNEKDAEAFSNYSKALSQFPEGENFINQLKILDTLN